MFLTLWPIWPQGQYAYCFVGVMIIATNSDYGNDEQDAHLRELRAKLRQEYAEGEQLRWDGPESTYYIHGRKPPKPKKPAKPKKSKRKS